MNIEWSDRYSVGVKIIDDQHQYFIGLINELFEALENREYSEKLDEILQKVLAYAEFHFKTEETLLESCNCPELQHQRNEHYKISHQLDSLAKKRDRVKKDLPFYYKIIALLKGWLINHLTTDDQLYVAHLKDHGIS